MIELTGTARLARFALLRDWRRVAGWVLAIVVLVVATAASVKRIFPTQADLDQAAASMQNDAASRALSGPPIALDTVGGQVAFQLGAYGLVAVGLMSLFMVGRLTRADEESGRTEMVRSMAVGRDAPSAAALAVVAGMNVVTGVGVGAGLAALGLPVGGAVTFGASYAAFGTFMSALTLVAAQVTENTRVAYGLGGALLGASYVVRAAGDAGSGAVSWFSPIGWAQKARPFGGDEWLPLLLPLAAAGVLVAVAVALSARRDVGGGLVPPRRGRPSASPGLGRPLGLALRLQRASLLAWSVAVLLTGATYGSIANEVEDLMGDSDAMQDLLARAGGDVVESYLSTTLLATALIGAGFAVQATLRVRSEEAALRAEPLLATRLSRNGWVAGHLVIALGGAVLVLLAGGLGMGVTYGLVADDLGAVPRVLGAALAYAPALWVLVGVAVLLFGWEPRLVGAAWAALAVCFILGMFGDVLELPSWVTRLSPFDHVPLLPAAQVTVVPLAALTATAAVLVTAGLGAFRHRDLR